MHQAMGTVPSAPVTFLNNIGYCPQNQTVSPHGVMFIEASNGEWWHQLTGNKRQFPPLRF